MTQDLAIYTFLYLLYLNPPQEKSLKKDAHGERGDICKTLAIFIGSSKKIPGGARILPTNMMLFEFPRL